MPIQFIVELATRQGYPEQAEPMLHDLLRNVHDVGGRTAIHFSLKDLTRRYRGHSVPWSRRYGRDGKHRSAKRTAQRPARRGSAWWRATAPRPASGSATALAIKRRAARRASTAPGGDRGSRPGPDREPAMGPSADGRAEPSADRRRVPGENHSLGLSPPLAPTGCCALNQGQTHKPTSHTSLINWPTKDRRKKGGHPVAPPSSFY